jgi:hypothetical protein
MTVTVSLRRGSREEFGEEFVKKTTKPLQEQSERVEYEY